MISRATSDVRQQHDQGEEGGGFRVPVLHTFPEVGRLPMRPGHPTLCGKTPLNPP